MVSSPITSWQIDGGNIGSSERLYFLDSKITADGDCSHKIKRHLFAPWKKCYDQPRQHVKKQRHYFANKCSSSQGYGLSSSYVWVWELNYNGSWAPKNWCFELWCWRRLLRVPWTARRSNLSILKEISPEYSLEGLMLKLKLNTWATWCEELTPWKRSWARKDWRQEEEGKTEDEIVRRYHWLNGHDFQQASEVGEGQGSLVCCSPRGHKESDMNELLNWTDAKCRKSER